MSIIPINATNTPTVIDTPFDNSRIRLFIINGKKLLNGDDICKLLKFRNSSAAIRNHISSENIYTLEQILRENAIMPDDGGYTPNELRSLYILEPSAYILSLIHI